MAATLCPHCHREGLLLEDVSKIAHVNYYRCFDGHIWTLAKDGSDTHRPPVMVTEIFREPPKH